MAYDKEKGRQQYLKSRERTLDRLAAKRRAEERPERHHLHATPEYKAWQSMKDRCLNPKCSFYNRYGGRGIRVHEPWIKDPVGFCHYIGPRPSPNYSLDRIDNSGDYVPGNVRWATYEEQNRNRRCSKLDEWDVRLIRFWRETGHRVKDIALAFGVTGSHVTHICQNSHWRV